MNWIAFFISLAVMINFIIFLVVTWYWVDYISWEYPEYHRTERNWLLVGVAFWIIEISVVIGVNA